MTTITIKGGVFTVAAGETMNFTDEFAFDVDTSFNSKLIIDGTVNASFVSPPHFPDLVAITTGDTYSTPSAIVIGATGIFNVVATVDALWTAGMYASGYGPSFTNKGTFSVSGVKNTWGLETSDAGAFDNQGFFHVTSSSGNAYGATSTYGGLFDNSGDIEVSGLYNATAVSYGGSFGQFQNSGTIHATSDLSGHAVAVAWAFGPMDNNWYNSGLIKGDVALQADVFSYPSPPAPHLENSGAMIGAVHLTDVADTFINTGTMTGDISFGDGNDIFLSSGTMKGYVDLGLGDDTMASSWQLDGAVNLGGGADVLEITLGSRITGLVDGGAGSDAVTFDTTRWLFAVHTSKVGGSFATTVQDTTYADGTTTIQNVETFAFAGYNFGFAGIQQNHQQNLDGGRFDDVLFQRTSTGTVYYQDMTGRASPGGFQSVLGALPAGWKAVGSADINGDGRADALIQDGSTGSLYYIDQSGGSSGWGAISTSIAGNWQYQGAGDLNGDGNVDVVVRDSTTGLVLYRDIAHSTWGTVLNAGLGWNTVGVGDFNRDGVSDVAVQNTSDGTVYYANMAGGVFSGWGSITGAVGAAWKAVGAGDINGDGYADVVFQNSSTGQVWWVDMLGGANHAWGVVANGLSGWTVRDIADLNNDGYADVVIQNDTDGTTYYADMHGGAFSGWGVVSGAVGTDWVVV